VIILENSPQIIQNDNLKNIFKIKFAYVTNDIAKTTVSHLSLHYTTPHGTVICGIDGMIGNHISHQ
jgi:hypothetical protein